LHHPRNVRTRSKAHRTRRLSRVLQETGIFVWPLSGGRGRDNRLYASADASLRLRSPFTSVRTRQRARMSPTSSTHTAPTRRLRPAASGTTTVT
jgi:hypothetical protein